MNKSTALDENAKREAFERDKVCYEQNFLQFRAMNQIMWQVPLIAITITGGLWYAALNVPGVQDFRRPMFLLSGALDFSLIAVLWRIRYVMAAYMKKIEAFNPTFFVKASGSQLFNKNYTVIWAFSFALFLAGLGSWIGFFNISWLIF